ALYAALAVLLVALVRPRASSWAVGAAAFALCVGVELLQLTEVPRDVVVQEGHELDADRGVAEHPLHQDQGGRAPLGVRGLTERLDAEQLERAGPHLEPR
ncbi:DUF2809 domain-containing protein, partial [Streptococcus pyogenes]|uniref:DUF2809 domain-containing protein n=1 Tax=Streptococcus pyogenes TaxID=1314 RepID=UPI003D9FD0D6